MRFKILALLGALAFATPMAAEAAPAGALTAHSYSDIATAPALATDASVLPGDTTAKIEKVWWRGGWRGRGFGWRGRGFGWRGGWGYRRFGWGGWGYRRGFYGYGWRRPFWRRRWYY